MGFSFHKPSLYYFFFFFLFSFFSGPNPWHMEVRRLRVQLELQLPAYLTATAMQGLSSVWDLPHNSQQRQIPHPQTEARDWTHILVNTSRVHYQWATTGTLPLSIFKWIIFYFALSYMNSSYILNINPLSDIWFANTFSHSVGSLFILLKVGFAVQKLFR